MVSSTVPSIVSPTPFTATLIMSTAPAVMDLPEEELKETESSSTPSSYLATNSSRKRSVVREVRPSLSQDASSIAMKDIGSSIDLSGGGVSQQLHNFDPTESTTPIMYNNSCINNNVKDNNSPAELLKRDRPIFNPAAAQEWLEKNHEAPSPLPKELGSTREVYIYILSF